MDIMADYDDVMMMYNAQGVTIPYPHNPTPPPPLAHPKPNLKFLRWIFNIFILYQYLLFF